MQTKKILIIGAGVAGQLLSKNIRKKHANIQIIGFVDDSNDFTTKKKLGAIKDLPVIVEEKEVQEIIIAIPSASGELIRKILLTLENSRIPIKIVPREQSVISYDKVEYSDVKGIDLEDFLGRPFIKKDIQKLKKFYTGKSILVTGGAGSIGSEIVKQLLSLDAKKVTVYDNSEFLTFNLDQSLKEAGIKKSRYQLVIGNILNEKKLQKVIHGQKPDMLFHVAAYKHVYLMEDNPEEAIINNVIGTKKVVDLAVRNKIKQFVFISTDKAVNPTSIMGSTKKLGEYYIKSVEKNSNTKFTIARFGNVINSNGSVLPLFERQIRENHYVTITHKEIRRYFMSIREAAHLVINSACYDQKGNVYLLNMGNLINIYEVAKCLMRSKNLIPDKDVKIKFIGLKKGEKMIEELFTEKEKANLLQTELDDIFCLKSYGDFPSTINDIISNLELLAIKRDIRNLKKALVICFSSLSSKN
jgi:FlaA1/EpsC-like NDP-sugar epimerase